MLLDAGFQVAAYAEEADGESVRCLGKFCGEILNRRPRLIAGEDEFALVAGEFAEAMFEGFVHQVGFAIHGFRCQGGDEIVIEEVTVAGGVTARGLYLVEGESERPWQERP